MENGKEKLKKMKISVVENCTKEGEGNGKGKG